MELGGFLYAVGGMDSPRAGFWGAPLNTGDYHPWWWYMWSFPHGNDNDCDGLIFQWSATVQGPMNGRQWQLCMNLGQDSPYFVLILNIIVILSLSMTLSYFSVCLLSLDCRPIAWKKFVLILFFCQVWLCCRCPPGSHLCQWRLRPGQGRYIFTFPFSSTSS